MGDPLTTALVVGGSGAVSSALNRPDTSAQRAQTAQNARSQEFIEQQSRMAQLASQRLFDTGQNNLLAGNEAALNLFQQGAPQQLSAFQQGNMNAQNQILAGLPQIQNAIMGTPVNYGAFTPRAVNVDTNFLQGAQLPNFQNAAGSLMDLNALTIAQQQQAIDAQIQEQVAAAVAAQMPQPQQTQGYTSRGGGNGQAQRDREGRGRSSSPSGRTSSGGRSNSMGGARGDGPGGSV